jgi:DNA (cytosine-5)-methyltransferase 1
VIADDLFAGAGGWDLAAARLGIHARGVENMKEARATRDAAGLTTIHDDVWTFGEWLDRGLRSDDPTWFRAALQIASPPCQTFSAAGKGSGRKALDDVLRGIRDGYVNNIEHLRFLGEEVGDPRTALVLTPLHYALSRDHYQHLAWEQVPTVLPVWEACAEVLRAQGWSVWTGLLQAEMFGVPQTRKRAFLLASREHEVAPPTPTHSRYHTRTPDKLDPGVPKWVSMAEGLGWGLLERPSYTVVGGSGGQNTNGTEWGSSAVRNALYGAQGDPEAWRERGWGLTGRPAPTITGGGTETGGAEPIAKLVERWASRPDWCYRRPATTVVGSFRPDVIAAPGYRVDVSRQNAPDSIRVSVSEAGILQSFPADYPWQGSKTRQYLQAGNAVPPGLAIHALAAAAGIERAEVAA